MPKTVGTPCQHVGEPKTQAHTQMYRGNARPGHWKFASYGDIWLVFHKLDNPQTTMITHCTADPGQDLSWGETVVTP